MPGRPQTPPPVRPRNYPQRANIGFFFRGGERVHSRRVEQFGSTQRRGEHIGDHKTDIAEQHLLNGYLDEEEYCRQRGISRRTAQRERRLRQGPPHTRLGSRVYYRIDAVRDWLTTQEVAPVRRDRTRRAAR